MFAPAMFLYVPRRDAIILPVRACRPSGRGGRGMPRPAGSVPVGNINVRRACNIITLVIVRRPRCFTVWTRPAAADGA